MLKISIIVCTYNRSELLLGCLHSLVEQTLDTEDYEVIIVNNNSTDNTVETVGHFAKTYNHIHIRIVTELNQGLSFARNRGWQEASGEYVAYIDDDALAPPDWVYQIQSFIDRQPNVSAFGGPYTSYSLVAVPDWFPPGYGCHSLGEDERPIVVGREWISGTNMIFKKKLFFDFGGFDENLGMSGSNVSYGEETNFLIKLSKNSIPVYYVPKINVRHLVAEYKMSLTWLLLSSYKVGRCYNLTFGKDYSLIVSLSKIGFSLLLGSLKLLVLDERYFKRKIYVAFAPLCIEVGIFFNLFSFKKRY